MLLTSKTYSIKMSRPYDMVVYGATGYTGQFVAAEAFRSNGHKKIAIAGRNKEKLEKVLDFMEEENGGEEVHSKVDMIIVDNSNYDSIREMCRQCRIVINCVGPFTFFGEHVIRACIELRTHHVDISGETKYLQMCQLKYHEEAKAQGIHIVGTCGFDSVPADFGLELLREKFPGKLTSASSYIHINGKNKVNIGTFNSIVQELIDQKESEEQKKLIFKEELPYIGPQSNQKPFGWAKSENRYFIPFAGPDAAVVKRTQLFESSIHGQTPIFYHAYLTVPSLIDLFFLTIFGLILVTFTKFKLGVYLLLRYPWLFSCGRFVSGGEEKRENLDESHFKMVIHGKGYSKIPEDPSEAGTPDKSMTLVFKGPELAYMFTSISIVAIAETILDDKLLNEGGVITPGSAFKGTRLEERLLKRGVHITVH